MPRKHRGMVVRYCGITAIGMGLTVAVLNADSGRAQRLLEPRTYRITMPDYRPESREVWHDGVNTVYRQLQEISNETLDVVTDKNLSDEKRRNGLVIIEQFSASMTASRLISVIDMKDDRGFFSGDVSRGKYPIVTVLANYGTAVNVHIRYALAHEADAHRRQLLCDVLEKTSGVERAVQELEAYRQKRQGTPAEADNLQASIAELQRRVME